MLERVVCNFMFLFSDVTKNHVKTSVKSFWDTDFESDAECHTATPRSVVLNNLKKGMLLIYTQLI